MSSRQNMSLAVGLLAVCACDPSPPPDKISPAQWERDVGQAPGVVVVHFYADWCKYCEKMRPAMDELAREVKVVYVDKDENPRLAASQTIRGIPATMVVTGGRATTLFRGATTLEKLRAAVAAARQGK